MSLSKVKISPSILSADFSNLGNEVRNLDEAGADMIHFDVMDGIFVPNITFGPDIIKSVRPYSKKCFDVHLMIDRPDHQVSKFIAAGANLITVHYESLVHVDAVINEIKSNDILAGVALVPSTPVEFLKYIINKLDLVLVMTVNPGWGGQSFLLSQIQKIRDVRRIIDESKKDVMLQVDGGIDNVTAMEARKAGADVLVSGSYILSEGSKKYKSKIESLLT